MAVYIPESGQFWALLSALNREARLLWDIGSDYGYFIPVAGDYDGDGITDPMIYGESQGYWAVLFSSQNYTGGAVSGWGGPGWVPVR